MEKLGQKIVGSKYFTLNNCKSSKKFTSIGFLLDITASTETILQLGYEIKVCINRYLFGTKNRISIYQSQNSVAKVQTVVENQTSDWVLHYWSQIQNVKDYLFI